MERLRRLEAIWSWLPAFRAVAETQHLPTAAAQLRLSASALSRSVRLLEGALGVPLFRRQGRSLQLNEAGAALLVTLRTAMRNLDDAVASARDETLAGPLSLMTTSDLAALYVEPALGRLLEMHPAVTPELAPLRSDQVVSLLLAGALDVAVVDEPFSHPALATTALGPLAMGLYARRAHPARRKRSLGLDYGLAAYDAPASAPAGFRLGMRLSTAELAARAAERLDLLVAGPDALLGARRALGRLRALPSRSILAVHRQSVGTHRRTEALLAALLAAANKRDRILERRPRAPTR